MTDEATEPFRQQATRQLAEILGAEVPPVFADTERIYVLKIGIRNDLTDRYPSADPERLSEWLRVWTSKATYLAAVRRHIHRIDLDGNEAGLISQDDIKYAGRRLKQLRKPAAQQSDDRSVGHTSPDDHVNQTEASAP